MAAERETAESEPSAIETRTLGDLANEQAARHPGAPRRGRPSRIGATSQPLLISGRPAMRFRPPASGEEEGEVQTIPVLSPTALEEGTFDVPSLQTSQFVGAAQMRERGLDEALTQVDDVVISLYPPFGSACVDERTAGVFVPTSCAIVRLDEESRRLLDPWYLVGYLSTRTLREEVLPAKTSRRTLSIDELASLELLLPPIDVQRRLGELARLHTDAARERWELNRLETSMVEGAYARTLMSEGGR